MIYYFQSGSRKFKVEVIFNYNKGIQELNKNIREIIGRQPSSVTYRISVLDENNNLLIENEEVLVSLAEYSSFLVRVQGTKRKRGE